MGIVYQPYFAKVPKLAESSRAADWTRILSLDSRVAVGGEEREFSPNGTRSEQFTAMLLPEFPRRPKFSPSDFTETRRLVLTCGFDCTIADGGTLRSAIEQLAMTYKSRLKAGPHVA